MLAAATAQGAIMAPREDVPCTLLPVTTGAWLLADLSDQTIDGNHAAIVGYNDGIRTKPKYVEIANALERPVQDGGKWFADGVTPITDDGLHPNPVGYRKLPTTGILLPVFADPQLIASQMPQTLPS